MNNQTNAHQELAEPIDEIESELIALLENCDHKKFNKIRVPGEWSPAQITDHIAKSLAGMNIALRGETKACDRDPATFLQILRDSLLNYDAKYNSPETLLPATDPQEKEVLISKLKYNFDKLKKAALTLAPEDICLAFEFPQIGYLTRLEIFRFAVWHTQRHMHQLKNTCHDLSQ